MIRSLLAILALATLWAAPALGAPFDHATHLTYLDDAACATCHVEGAEAIKPAETVCLECHEKAFVEEVTFPGLKTHGPVWAFNHRPAAKNGAIDCSACHQQDFCLECHSDAGRADEMGAFGNAMVNVHRSDFHVTHPIAARTDPQLCSSCHEQNFCRECHEQFAPADLALDSHRRSWSDLTVSGTPHETFPANSCQTCHPNSVLPSHEWSSRHSREARKNLATCQACHPDGDICLKCHSAKSGLMVNPHPKDFSDFSGRLDRASGGKTCRKCH
ncbi:hypothetical protein JCM30471_19360 [Desulfuromonas carbonis]